MGKVFWAGICLIVALGTSADAAVLRIPIGSASPSHALLAASGAVPSLVPPMAAPALPMQWTSREFVRDVARNHEASLIMGEAVETRNSVVEASRFVRDALGRRGDKTTLLPRVTGDESPEAVRVLERRLQDLFDGGVARKDIEVGAASLSWGRDGGNHYAKLVLKEGGREMRFTVHGPRGMDPRIEAFNISMGRQEAHYNLISNVSLSQSIAKDGVPSGPIKLRASVSPTPGEFLIQLQATLSGKSELLRSQAERAARLALLLLQSRPLPKD